MKSISRKGKIQRDSKLISANMNIPYYMMAIGLFILLKFSYTLVDIDSLTFLLKPTDKFIELLTGSQSVYHTDHGYYHYKLNILIDKSCSGFNFWLLCSLMLTFLTLKYFDKHFKKLLIIPISWFLAYLLTLFVNTSRIFASIIIQSQTNIILVNRQQIIHESIGIVTNLIFLIITYFLTEKYLNRQQNEKHT